MLRRNELVSAVHTILINNTDGFDAESIAKEIVETILRMQQK